MESMYARYWLVLLLLPLVSASCNFLDVSTTLSAQTTQGLQAAYPITLFNEGLQPQLVQLSGTCPQGLTCTFQPSSQAVLTPSETRTLTLVVDADKTGNHSIPVTVTSDSVACDVLNFSLDVRTADPLETKAFGVRVFPEGNSSARPGQTVSFEVSIRNHQNERGFARLKVISPLEKSTDFDYVDIDVPAQGEKTVTAKVNIPAGTPRNTYEVLFVINAFDGSGCCEHSFLVKRQVFVFSDLLKLQLQDTPSSCLLVKHEQETTHTFRLRNDGEVQGPFEFELVGNQYSRDASHLDTQALDIAPGDYQELKWILNPPSTTVLDEYHVILRGRYQDYVVFEQPLCFVVDAQRDFTVFANESYPITRGEQSPIAFTVRNTGTIARTYTVTANPPAEFDFRVDAPSFTLSPSQIKAVTLAVGSTKQAQLGEHKLDVTVSDGRVRKSLNAYMVVSSSLQPGKSFLEIKPEVYDVYAGITEPERVAVTNAHAKTQTNVRVRVDGLPENWVTQSAEQKHIVPGKTAPFDIAFNIPVDQSTQQRQIQITAESDEGEKTRIATVLQIREAPSHLDVAVTTVNRNGNDVTYTVVVYNNGLKTLNQVNVNSGGSIQTISQLEPGEQQTVTFTALAAAPLTVQAQSQEGVQSQTVQVPLNAESRLFSLSGLLIAVIILMLVLVAVAFMLRKEHLDEVARQQRT
ncbi:hypothetical protein HY572_05010 [Candidatus Micrarchaeota archaeon]|nr:hypothetical protein [Candidatus Micrarchaeota archaeon]